MNRENLLEGLKKATANATDVYFELYTRYFENGDAPAEALEVILDYSGRIGDTEDINPKTISREDEIKMLYAFESIISGTANRIAGTNPVKKEFYQKLYETIFASDSDLYPQSKEEKVIALKILSERVLEVPYYQIVEIDITEEDFDKAKVVLKPKLQEAFCMLRRKFSNTFELMAQIIRIADGITEEKEKVIFWSIFMNRLKKKDD